MPQAAAHALADAAANLARRSVTLFDTTEDGNPREAGFYGTDVKGVREVLHGIAFITVSGPEGEVCLPDWAWKNAFKAMGVA